MIWFIFTDKLYIKMIAMQWKIDWKQFIFKKIRENNENDMAACWFQLLGQYWFWPITIVQTADGTNMAVVAIKCPLAPAHIWLSHSATILEPSIVVQLMVNGSMTFRLFACLPIRLPARRARVSAALHRAGQPAQSSRSAKFSMQQAFPSIIAP